MNLALIGIFSDTIAAIYRSFAPQLTGPFLAPLTQMKLLVEPLAHLAANASHVGGIARPRRLLGGRSSALRHIADSRIHHERRGTSAEHERIEYID
jgi:hypothetical protein